MTANPAGPAWPAFKLIWLRDNNPVACKGASQVLAPNDYINFRLTGGVAMDRTEARCSFLMDPQKGDCSSRMVADLGIDQRVLPLRPSDPGARGGGMRNFRLGRHGRDRVRAVFECSGRGFKSRRFQEQNRAQSERGGNIRTVTTVLRKALSWRPAAI